jgi:putative nucleotidyltransferase with HDIG domain
LTVYSEFVEAFDAPAVKVFQRLGEHIVSGIRMLHQQQLLAAGRLNLAESQKHVADALSATVAAMVTAIEVRDPYTAGHEIRVATIAVAIGREMGWDENRLQGIRLAAMVHDIGKIVIPPEILTKPSRLSAAEFAMIKEHPETGYNILKGVPFTWPIAEMVRQHHEKLDGSGYPLGLKADEILAESKVLAVADIVEAMASDRPYRRSHGLETALRQIESEAGTLLDPETVRICVALFREKRLVVPGLNQD